MNGNLKKIVGSGVFAGLCYVISLLEFPIFSAIPYIKLDFSMTFVALGGFLFGPQYAVIISLVKELIVFLTHSSTAGVGEISNFIISMGFCLLPSIVYIYKKGIKSVIATLVFGIIIQTGLALLSNRFIIFPLYMGESGREVFNDVWLFVLLFNLIKGIAVSVITVLLYKRLSNLFKMIPVAEKQRKKDNSVYKQEDKLYNINMKIGNSEKETLDIAFEYAKTLKSGDVVLLEGELGAGKTAFTKGIAKYFNLSGVTSPTYAYLNVYGDYIYHYDCYRLSSGEDALMLGLTDYFNGDNICIIEWAENIIDVLPPNCKKVKIEKQGEKRVIYL